MGCEARPGHQRRTVDLPTMVAQQPLTSELSSSFDWLMAPNCAVSSWLTNAKMQVSGRQPQYLLMLYLNAVGKLSPYGTHFQSTVVQCFLILPLPRVHHLSDACLSQPDSAELHANRKAESLRSCRQRASTPTLSSRPNYPRTQSGTER